MIGKRRFASSKPIGMLWMVTPGLAASNARRMGSKTFATVALSPARTKVSVVLCCAQAGAVAAARPARTEPARSLRRRALILRFVMGFLLALVLLCAGRSSGHASLNGAGR